MTEEVVIEEVVAPVVAETTAEEKAVEVAAQTPEQEAAAKEEKAKAELQKGVQRRIDKITKARYEAEARAKMLEERVAAMEARQAPKDAGMPTIEQFDNFDAYVSAKAAYIAKQQIESTLTERERRQSAEREATERRKTVESWNKRVEKATAEMPDFEEVISSSEVPMTEPMQQAIMESDAGPKLAYYLANNPDEAREIARMSPIGAIRTLGRIEERLSKPVEKKPTNTPAPLTPLGSSAKVSKDPAEMSQKEFEAWRKTIIKAR